ncbi:LysR family transcriptional regulator [Rhodanobacter glycinis]|uniref:LysR family transcriptional regulator n=1 Tax=Rhodanobacter glycinis TaxID=582702 RepID=A0A5B9E0F9_9GAMM|nr:LysR family transcriptional regulator [Rhodanobacter glycinis]QEE24405.1 LysR family transcriptional regulator [Rhodanobacter glycinis]
MSYRPSFAELNAFSAIAAHRSFRKAADELGLAPSTLSHMMRALEAGMGLRLLHRTTRSVSATEAGAQLLERLQPVLRDLDLALDEVNGFRAEPRGSLRINTNEAGARLLLQNVVPMFMARCPEVEVDLVTEGRLVDIVAEGFDAGVRLGEAVPHDMIAVRISGPTRFVSVASPAYLQQHKHPKTPEDLKQHRCIRIRMASGKRYRWEFEKRSHAISVDVPGSLTLDHHELMAETAARDLGVAYLPEHVAAPWIARGDLCVVLADWCPVIPGLFLYYPGHRHVPPTLRAFVAVVKEVADGGNA